MRRTTATSLTSALIVSVLLAALSLAPTVAQDPEAKVAATGDVTVDEGSDGFRRVGQGWRSALGGYEGQHRWLPARTTQSRVGIWSAAFDGPGLYKVLARVPERHAGSRKAVYKVKTASGWAKRVRSQSKNRGRWMSLGVHRLGAQAEVRLTDKTLDPRGSGRKLAFDAVRFVALESPAPPVIESLDVDAKHNRAIVTFRLAEPGPARTHFRRAGTAEWRLGANETSSKYAKHEEVIRDLRPETEYELRVVATNLGGNAVSPVVRFTTLPPPPPVINDLQVAPEDTRAIVTFGLAQKGPASSEYREQGDSAWIVGADETSSKWADHRQVITGLRPETAYELRVVATNAGGRTMSDIMAFRTESRTVDCAAGAKLQAAIEQARPGDTLIIRGTCHGHFVVDKDLTLRGRDGATLNGGGSGVLVKVTEFPANKRVELVGMVLRNAGYCVIGEQKESGLRVRDVTVTGCDTGVATLDSGSVSIADSHLHGNGTAVYAGQVAGASIVDSVIEDNRTGVKSLGSASIEGSTIRRNGPGGGVRVVQYLTLRDSRIIGNQAISGGGIDVGGLDTSVTIEDTLVRGNRADGRGGGMYRRLGSITDTTLRNVVFEDNVAGIDGGGLYNEDPGIVMTNVTFTNNNPNGCSGC